MDVPRIHVPSGYHVVSCADGSFDVVADAAVNPVAAWVADRSAEKSTRVGVIGGAVLAPTLADNFARAVAAGIAGDYLGAAMYGIPAVTGIVGAVTAIILPDSNGGVCGDEFKSKIAGMSRDDIMQLLVSSGGQTDGVPVTNGSLHG